MQTLYAKGAAAAAPTFPLAAVAYVTSPAAISPRLQRLMALYDRAEAECERFDVAVEMPARQACAAAKKALPIEQPPPHEQSATAFVNVFGETVRLSTENVGTAAVALCCGTVGRSCARPMQRSCPSKPSGRRGRGDGNPHDRTVRRQRLA